MSPRSPRWKAPHAKSRSLSARRRSRHPAGRRPIRVELQFLPGLAEIVADEAADRIDLARPPRPVPGRDDALIVAVPSVAELPAVLELRTIVAAYILLCFEVPRPRSLLGADQLDRIAAAMAQAHRLGSVRSFRFDAAGRNSPVFRTLAERLAAATGLAYEPEDGDCVLRFRRSVDTTGEHAGWDVLVRLSARPLSSRPWRTASFPGALNASVAAAAVRMSKPRADDRVLNLMCGSGTLLIERLEAGPAANAVGVDRDPAATEITAASAALAGVSPIRLITADISTLTLDDRFDAVFACPPWGDKVGRHEDVDGLHRALLDRAYDWTNPGARLVVISHRVRSMAHSLAARRDRWRELQQTRVWTKGHHPRIYLLRRH